MGIDRPVVDLTDLKGAYDFQFEIGFGGAGKRGGDRPGEGARSANPLTAADDSGPTIFDAMAQLGLKLDAAKRPMPVIVIDRVERTPTEN